MSVKSSASDGSKACHNRESLLRLRRRQKVERLIQGFCFRNVDLRVAEQLWVAAQDVLLDYDSGEELSDNVISRLENQILSAVDLRITAESPYAASPSPTTHTERSSTEATTRGSSHHTHEPLRRPRGEVDEWATLQVL
jgi:hypothetical protein